MGTNTQASNLALKNTLNEIKNICPDISNAFIFRENGEILAQDQDTTQLTISHVQEAFRALDERANVIGGIESVTFRGADSTAKITEFDDFYVTNVASNQADEKTIANLTRVMIPTMLKLAKEMDMQEKYPSSKKQVEQAVTRPKPEQPRFAVTPPETQTHKFKVENFAGSGHLLNNPDKAYIDSALIVQWQEAFGDKEITQISLENPITGKRLLCAFRTFTDSKFEGKGIIQLSEKIQHALKTHKGEQIILKPITEPEETVAATEEKAPTKTQENKTTTQPEKTITYQPYMPDAPFSQVIIENLGGFLGNPDFVRVDRALIAQWTELFGDKKIKQVIIEETTTRKTVQCKFQPIKDSNLEGKGIIQLPEKFQKELETKKGALVIVKPVVE